MLKRLLLAGAILALTACATEKTASAAPPTGQDCFLSRQINGYGVVDDHHVRVDAGPSRKYILATDWNARDLNWGEHIALHSTTDWICTGNGLGTEIIGGRPRQTYPISSITREPPPPAHGS